MTGLTVQDIIRNKRTIMLTLGTGCFLGFCLNIITMVLKGQQYTPIVLTSVAAGVLIGQFLLLTDLRMEKWNS